MKSLFDEVRGEQNIFSAWRHVKRSALTSGSSEIRGKASEFENEHQKHLYRLITQLREGRFKFDPVQGVLKDRQKRLAQGKDPRPIAIASLKNRIVQRAILQVLQPRVLRNPRDPNSRAEGRLDSRLGKINEINRSRFGVGGLLDPYGGVRPAIRTIRSAIDDGAKFYYQSDIRAFFTRIPVKEVVNIVRSETNDELFVDLFERGLEVHLGNPEELKGYAHLFPSGGIGVAQGSSLSAFAGNALLYELDHALNEMGVTAVRYIDDILIVSKDQGDLNKAIEFTEDNLSRFNFGLYSASDGSGKASRGECASAINFLGCTIQPRRCIPSAQSIANIKAGVRELLTDSKSAIKEMVRIKDTLEPKFSQSSTLALVGKKLYGWEKAFAFCTDSVPFQNLDDYVSKQIEDYLGFVGRVMRGSDTRTKMMICGIPSTRVMFELSRDKP